MTHHEQPGRVRVSIETSASIEAVFEALVQSGKLASWFGTPAAPLRPGGATRIDLGDGDFFSIDRIALEPPGHVSYESRFLGLGAKDLISWIVARQGALTLVTVTDDHPGRSPQEAEVMREGWRDFLGRLARYLATGQCARYDWRRDVDGGVELTGSAEAVAARLFTPDGLDRWQPWCTTAWRSGARLLMADGAQPSTLHLAKLERGDSALRLVVAAPEWRQETHVRLAVQPHRDGSTLTFSHTGWGGIDTRDEVQRSQRERFCNLWVASLERASTLIGEA